VSVVAKMYRQAKLESVSWLTTRRIIIVN